MEEIYEIAENFKLRSVPTEWKKGYFFFTRFVWNFRAERGKWWQLFLFHFFEFFLLLPISITIDLIVMILRLAIEILKILTIKSLELIFDVIKNIFEVIIKAFGKAIAWALVIVVLLFIGIAVYYNFENITALINNVVHKFI